MSLLARTTEKLRESSTSRLRTSLGSSSGPTPLRSGTSPFWISMMNYDIRIRQQLLSSRVDNCSGGTCQVRARSGRAAIRMLFNHNHTLIIIILIQWSRRSRNRWSTHLPTSAFSSKGNACSSPARRRSWVGGRRPRQFVCKTEISSTG